MGLIQVILILSLKQPSQRVLEVIKESIADGPGRCCRGGDSPLVLLCDGVKSAGLGSAGHMVGLDLKDLFQLQ